MCASACLSFLLTGASCNDFTKQLVTQFRKTVYACNQSSNAIVRALHSSNELCIHTLCTSRDTAYCAMMSTAGDVHFWSTSDTSISLGRLSPPSENARALLVVSPLQPAYQYLLVQVDADAIVSALYIVSALSHVKKAPIDNSQSDVARRTMQGRRLVQRGASCTQR